MSGFGETQRYCPDDSSPLIKRNERGVTIDECQRCGIIVLDHGELPAIISQIASQPNFRPQPQVAQAYYGGHGGGHGGHGGGHRPYHRTSGIFSSFFGSS